MNISVVISTYNNCERLRITLEAMKRCRAPKECSWELVLVNNVCTDATDEVAQEFEGQLPLVYVHEPRLGVSHGRNAGLRAASGELIVSTDDDCKPCPGWLEAYWQTYREKGKGFYYGGPTESEFEGEKPSEELLRVAPCSVRGLDYGGEARALDDEEEFIGGNWACGAEALRRVGYYDTRLGPYASSNAWPGGEETDLMERLRGKGLSGYYVPEARVTHFVPSRKCTIEHIVGRAEACGRGEVLRHYDEYISGPRIFGAPRWAYRQMVTRWLGWVWARLRGRKGYREQLAFRTVVGTLKGCRGLNRVRSDHSEE